MLVIEKTVRREEEMAGLTAKVDFLKRISHFNFHIFDRSTYSADM
jgi:hypothetical protein